MAQKPSRPSLWQRWVDPKQLGTGTLLIIIGVIVTALIGTSFALVKSGTVEVFSGDGDPIIDEITSRDIWVTRPETFPSASERDSETAHLDRSRGGADLIVVTPDKLVRKAAEYDGMNVFLAGKVASSIRLPSDGFSEELTLATERNQLAFIRRDTPDSTESTMFRRGDVVYALGRVAAIGRARDATGREHQAAYFLASVIDVYIYPMEVWSHALQEALDRLVRMYGWGRNIRPLKP